MSRLVILVLLVLVVGWWLHGRMARLRQPGAPQAPGGSRGKAPAPQDMVVCAHCGVHLPSADAWIQDRLSYCCEEHRRLGPKAS